MLKIIKLITSSWTNSIYNVYIFFKYPFHQDVFTTKFWFVRFVVIKICSMFANCTGGDRDVNQPGKTWVCLFVTLGTF